MEGLEISEIYKSLLHGPERLEAEYYRKHYISLELRLKTKQLMPLSLVTSKITDGTHFTPSYTETGVPFLSALNVLENRLTTEVGHKYISEEEHNELYRRCDPKAGDVLVRKIGVGPRWAAVVPSNMPTFSLFVSVALLRPRVDIITPEMLAAFINSKYGQTQLIRVQKGASQPDLHLEDIKDIFVPIFSEQFQSEIVRLHECAIQMSMKGDAFYRNAELLLFGALNYKNALNIENTISVQSFKNSFLATGRLDAEYYQPKYLNSCKVVTEYVNGYEKLSNSCRINDVNFNPEDEVKYKYIELSNIDKAGVITGYTQAAGIELPSRARRLVNEGDVLISSIEGSLTSCAIVTAELNGALCSTGFYVIQSPIINSETLLVLFKSQLMQELLKQGCSGTILTAINKNEFLNLPIPLIDKAMQRDIFQLVQASFKLKAESLRLTDAVKLAVEVAIEQDEAAALRYINSETQQNAEDFSFEIDMQKIQDILDQSSV